MTVTPQQPNEALEDRLYELLATTKDFDEIADELGISGDELGPLMSKVISERGDPLMDKARREREALSRIRF